jgi:hypothetical protein
MLHVFQKSPWPPEAVMKNIFIATIGNRDIKYVEDNQLKDIFPARTRGEEIYKNIKQYIDAIRMPLLEETFKYLIYKGIEVDMLILVVTDQQDPGFSARDTVWFGKIIQKILRERKFKEYRKKIGIDGLVFNRMESFVLTDCVNDFEENFEFFNSQFLQLKQEVEEIGNIIIEYTGGIPQVNYALILSALFNFDSREVIPIVVDERDKLAVESSIVSKTLEEINKIQLKRFIQRYDYKSPLAAVIGLDPVVRQILSIVSARLDFDFSRSYRLLVELRKLDKNKKAYDKLSHLLGKELGLERRLEEIYYHLEMKLRNEEYLDFLSRFYCFYDNYLHVLLKPFGYNVVEMETENERREAHNRFIEGQPGLREFLESIGMPNFVGNTGTKLRFNMAKFYYKDEDKFREIREINKKFDSIIEIRNRTIIAHRLEGVTKKDFSGIYEQDVVEEILADIRIFLAFAGIHPKQNIFDQINDIIIDNLKTGSVFSGSLKSVLNEKGQKSEEVKR